MSDKIEPGLKEYVFAMYIGQKVLKYDIAGEVDKLDFTSLKPSNLDFASVLHLRPLSSITDSEAIEVANIFGFDLGRYNIVRSSRGIEIDNTEDELFNLYWSGNIHYKVAYEIDVQSSCIDYLRQQSFALPIYYKGVNYSVEKLTELGIIKLTGTELDIIIRI